MKEIKFGIEKMEDDLNNIIQLEDYIKSSYEEDVDEKTYNKLLDNFLNDDVVSYDHEPFKLLRGNKTQLDKFFNTYFDRANDQYEYYENEYSRFGDHNNYLANIDKYIMYLCGRYFALQGDNEKENKSYLLSLCCSTFEEDVENEDYEVDEDRVKVLDLFVDKFDTVKDMLYPDFLALHPEVTYNIGKYYLYKKNYKKAFEYFTLGSKFNYDGRQSIKPFINVGKNLYELGMMYFKGQYVEQDYHKSFELFKEASENAGEPSIPILGDMYFFGYGVEQDYDDALRHYVMFNKYCSEFNVYYKYLNKDQKLRLKSLCEFALQKEDLSYGYIDLLLTAYTHKIYDNKRIDELLNRKLDIINKTPLDKRSELMNSDYVDYVLTNLKNTLKEPKENTGLIPKDLKVGDIFTFGKFNNEPLEWKVLEINDNGSFFVVTTKIIVKLSYDKVFKWLNNDFFKFSFTEEEKKHIEGHNYPQFIRFGKTYLYLLSSEQFTQFEGKYKKGTIKETEFAKSLSSTKEVFCGEGNSLLENGEPSNIIDWENVKGIRPAMDIFVK